MTELFSQQPDAITVLELNQRLSDAIARCPSVKNVWVVGETSDVRVSGGHCYFELVEKDDNGANRSRVRAIIWANNFHAIANRFSAFTGVNFTSGIKVRVRVTASYHAAYGMSVTVSEVDAAYTAGDALRRRAEIIKRLTDEGLINLNRSLQWPFVPNRIAIISAQGAAGYGDFINQLFHNAGGLRFDVRLFEAVMQGDNTVPSVLMALEKIEYAVDEFDAVVIIRGGGSTSDLSAFDNYELAAAIARFPLPIIIGIGHERDVTALDYVANHRVNTPTAAAEFLIDRVSRFMEALNRAADNIYRFAAERIAANRELLAHAAASLPGLIQNIVTTRHNSLERLSVLITTAASAAINLRRQQLIKFSADIINSSERAIERNDRKLAQTQQLLKVLSPDSVLARGFSLTMLPDGKILRNPNQVSPHSTIKTILATGSIVSAVESISEKD